MAWKTEYEYPYETERHLGNEHEQYGKVSDHLLVTIGAMLTWSVVMSTLPHGVW